MDTGAHENLMKARDERVALMNEVRLGFGYFGSHDVEGRLLVFFGLGDSI
jgi:hypothetical protein